MVMHDVYTNLTEQYQPLLEPLTKINKLVVTDLEKLVTFQMSTLTSYMDLTLGELKSVSQVTDAQSLQQFYQRQLELGTALHKKMIDDAARLFELATGFESDFAKLAAEYPPTQFAAEAMPAMLPQTKAA